MHTTIYKGFNISDIKLLFVHAVIDPPRLTKGTGHRHRPQVPAAVVATLSMIDTVGPASWFIAAAAIGTIAQKHTLGIIHSAPMCGNTR